MKNNRSRAYITGGKFGESLYQKWIVASLIIALLLGALPTNSVFAALGPGQNRDLEQGWANKRSQLATAVAFFNNFQTRPGQDRNAGNMSQYLDRYAAAMTAAQALIANGSNGFNSNGQVTNENQANRSLRQLENYLSMMRGLRNKIAEGGGNTNRNNNNGNNVGNTNGGNNAGNTNGNNNGVGIPVTGGNDTNNSTNQNFGQNSPAKVWGNQFRELQAATVWYNNFRTRPGSMRNSNQQAKLQQYLDRYAFALSQASAIVINGSLNSNGQSSNNNATGQTNNGSNGQNTTSSWGSSQQQLAMYLSMMRGIREKITGIGRHNTTTTTSGGGQQTP